MSDTASAWIGFAFAILIVGLTKFLVSIREPRRVVAAALGMLTMIVAALHGAYLGVADPTLIVAGPVLALSASFIGAMAAMNFRKQEPETAMGLARWSVPGAAFGLLLVLFISRRTIMYFFGLT